MDNNNIETLIIQERIRKNALNRASYLRRKANGTNNALIPIELQKTRGRKPKPIDENELIITRHPVREVGQHRLKPSIKLNLIFILFEMI